MKKFPRSLRGACVGLGLLACLCSATFDPLFGGAAAATLPAVTVTASDPQAAEPGTDAGAFTFRRTLATNKPLTVYYRVGGTAARGADYAALSGSVVIKAGLSSAVVKVTPLDDAAAEGAETVTVTVSTSRTYSAGAPAGAAVNIQDNEPAPVPTPTPTPTPAPAPTAAAFPSSETTVVKGSR